MALARRKRDGAIVVARDDDQKFGLRELLAVENPSIAEVLVTLAATAAAIPAVLGFLALIVAARTMRDVSRALPSLWGALSRFLTSVVRGVARRPGSSAASG